MQAEPDTPLVLIVDDYEDALHVYQQYLVFKGYRVITASCGAEAIAVARTHQPALIFMDLRMPRMDGTEAMRQLRRDPGFVSVPIVALTAHAHREEQERALSSGFDAVITKPCLPDELVVAIDQLLATRAPPSQPREGRSPARTRR